VSDPHAHQDGSLATLGALKELRRAAQSRVFVTRPRRPRLE
jgi:hypothetical protein